MGVRKIRLNTRILSLKHLKNDRRDFINDGVKPQVTTRARSSYRSVDERISGVVYGVEQPKIDARGARGNRCALRWNVANLRRSFRDAERLSKFCVGMGVSLKPRRMKEASRRREETQSSFWADDFEHDYFDAQEYLR